MTANPIADGRGPVRTPDEVAFGQLDFLYTPSADVVADSRYFRDVLGGEVVFAIEAMGTKVAMVRLGGEGPAILRTGTASSTVIPPLTDPLTLPSSWTPPSSPNTLSLARLTRLRLVTLCS